MINKGDKGDNDKQQYFSSFEQIKEKHLGIKHKELVDNYRKQEQQLLKVVPTKIEDNAILPKRNVV